MTISFTGRAKKLEDVDLPRIGHEIGVGEDVIHAIIDVEAPKAGFDPQGRPRILFEPHIFYRELGGGNKRVDAVRQGLAYENWKRGAYGPESAQYGKLERALALDETAALKSCSWGRSQIMGFNHLLAGYATPQEMVREFCDDEDNHIEAMVRFLKTRKIRGVSLDAYLRQIDKLNRPSTGADWAPVAEGYNGSGYAVHDYHGRLAKAHNWWKARPDTPWSPTSLPAPGVALPPADPVSAHPEITTPTPPIDKPAPVRYDEKPATVSTSWITAFAEFLAALFKGK